MVNNSLSFKHNQLDVSNQHSGNEINFYDPSSRISRESG